MSLQSIVVIPARANSIRLPQKNKKTFHGKPLISWTIEAALHSKSVSKVYVSTDDVEILSMASVYPSVVFDKRPDHLALDNTPSLDPVLELIERHQINSSYLTLLQPTSPLRNSVHIDEAFSKLLKSNKKQIVSVKRLQDPLSHIMVGGEHENKSLLIKKHAALAEKMELSVLNGAIYITDCKTLISEKTFLGSSLELYEMSEYHSVDIDTKEDWQRAELYADFLQFKKE
jgi:CMP-N,N'-diacetyllegionaminic acid synthase